MRDATSPRQPASSIRGSRWVSSQARQASTKPATTASGRAASKAVAPWSVIASRNGASTPADPGRDRAIDAASSGPAGR